MSKVIGFDPTAAKRCTCKECTAIIEYTPSEVRRVDGKDYSGGPDGKEYILCPNCGSQVILRSW